MPVREGDRQHAKPFVCNYCSGKIAFPYLPEDKPVNYALVIATPTYLYICHFAFVSTWAWHLGQATNVTETFDILMMSNSSEFDHGFITGVAM